jgi:hypothetical protein
MLKFVFYVLYNVYFPISSFDFLAVVGEHDSRCCVIILYQPRLVEVLPRVVRIFLYFYCAMPVTVLCYLILF